MAILEEWAKVKTNPEFRAVWDETRAEVSAQAAAAWGIADGGMMPGPREFGETTIRTVYFNLGTTSGTAELWERTFAAAGWQTMINHTTIEDVYIGIVGWMLPNTTQRTKAIYQEYGQTKLPVVEYEGELESMEIPVIVFEQGVVIPEETDARVDFLIKSAGKNIIKPLGMAMVKSNILIKKKPV